jgi:NAD(P)-dependent dehydrogenase (short-subunit alcohol dehydrogenase family)
MAKTVLITGAAIRIGSTVALSLVDAGWDIALHYHNSEKEALALAKKINAKKRAAYLVKADLSDAEAVAQIIPALNSKGIMLDCLINNVAVFEKDNLAKLTEASWQAHMNINLFAPLQLVRDFAAQYKGKEGNIINITDGLTGWSISPNFLSYSLSKLGLGNATTLLARELAPNIRINAIAPGPTLEGKQDKADTFAKLKKIIPLARTNSPEEICDTIQYILSVPSLTGNIINLAGGMQIAQNSNT